MLLTDKYKLKMREALVLALPIIAGQVGQVLMGFFDTVQIGGLGSTYIAGAGFANNVYWVVNLLGLGILFAVSPLVSESLGEKKSWKAIGVFRSGLKISLIVSALFTAVMFIIKQNIGIFHESETLNALAVRYLNVINYSTVFMLLFTLGNQFMNGLGRPKVGMIMTLGGLLLNIFLNWVLIYGKLGFPALSIEGTALATTISRAAMAAGILIFIWRDKKIKQLRDEFLKHEDRKKSYVLPIMKIGVPAGLQFFWEVAAFSAGQIMSGWLGDQYLASHQISIGLASITFMVITGIASAGTIMTGFSFGAKDLEGIKIAGNTVFILTVLFEICFALFFVLFKSMLPQLYTSDAEVIAISSSVLVFAAIFQISDGMQAVAAGALRGIQDVKIPAVIAFISYWMVMIPACYLLAFTYHLGIKGIWIGFIVGLTVAAVLQLVRFKIKLGKIQFTDL
jgi:MATE family multidrug resistance protein